MLNKVRSIIPLLSYSSHKGNCGKVGVIGGSLEYTGAPYFSAMTALRLGADLSHIFCSKDAGTSIKTYSPDLIVHPVLENSDNFNEKEFDVNLIVNKIEKWFPSLHVLIIGPGLGRTEQTFSTISLLIEKAKESNLPIIIDADGLFLISKKPELIMNYNKAILTPNVIEFSRLVKSVQCDNDILSLSQKMGVGIIQKGKKDLICNGETVIECRVRNSPRRCGGQGDLTSGAIGLFYSWALNSIKLGESVEDRIPEAILIAGFAGCSITRHCNQAAFIKHKRSMVANDMIQEIGQVFDNLFPDTYELLEDDDDESNKSSFNNNNNNQSKI